MSIRVEVESEGVINFLTKIDTQIEDSIEEIIEKTVEEVEAMARKVIEDEFTFDMSRWPMYYHGEKQVNGTEGSVTIPHDFVPINVFDYENLGIGGDAHTIKHDAVEYEIHNDVKKEFKSNYFLNNSNAHYRTTTKSKPFHSLFLPDIPQMLWEEKRTLMDLLEEAFNKNIEEALGSLF